ncbi:septation protein A [Chromobacterium violaceum]|nr:septation protein A [Chromobacterium violaceum]
MNLAAPAPIITRMKFLIDFFPVALFFGAYWINHDIFFATKVLIGASVLQIAWIWIKHKKVETIQWISFILCIGLGSVTLISQNDIFIKWKPTVLYWIMGLGLGISELTGKSGLKLMLGQQIELPPSVWRKLTWAWCGFFAFMGILNLFVAYNFSKDIWVDFKLFGGMGLMLLFVIAQSLFLAKYIEEKK